MHHVTLRNLPIAHLGPILVAAAAAGVTDADLQIIEATAAPHVEPHAPLAAPPAPHPTAAAPVHPAAPYIWPPPSPHAPPVRP